MNTQDRFLTLCSDSERPVFQRVMQSLESLAATLAEPTAPASDTDQPIAGPSLRFEYADKAAILKLTHTKLLGAPVPVLYLWPSSADRSELPNTMAVGCKVLRDAGVQEKDLQTYGAELAKADFEKERNKGWRTMTFKQERPDRLGCLYADDVKCGDINLRALLTAVQNLVLKINTYPTPVPPPPREKRVRATAAAAV